MTRAGAIAWVGMTAALFSMAPGCNFNDEANGAHGCESCTPGMCFHGFCLQAAERGVEGIPGAGTGDTGGTGGTQAGSGGSTSVVTAGADGGSGTGVIDGPCTESDVCFTGPAASRSVGLCRDGSMHCTSEMTGTCMGQVLPSDELCNGMDDDCDGNIDETLVLGSCPTTGSGACATGVLACEAGVATCQSSTDPSPETCNGVDDDCDGEVDNDVDERCYPVGTPGCELLNDGSFGCAGLCAPGTRTCVNGTLSACTGFVQPVPEICGGTQAADEDCDGQVDDDCPCSGDQTQRCYTGAAGTAGIGICVSGTQHCENGAFGACVGAITPVAESCGNLNDDDDCNRVVDDIPRLGTFCTVNANQGNCRFGTRLCQGGSLGCVTPAPRTETCDNQDEDCDGVPDNQEFDLANDERNCGQCGADCDSGDTCCGGACSDTDDDPNNCGACGVRCGEGRACCNGMCEDLGSDDHCSSCSPCGANQDCCGGQCLERGTSENCSACNACDGGAQDCCDGQCLDRGTADNCSACNACDGSSQDCCNGQCLQRGTAENCSACNACVGGSQDCCDGQCLDRGTAQNCSACHTCDGSNEDCCDGQCLARGTAQNCSACAACDGNTQDCCNGACLERGTPENCSSCISCAGPTQSCCHDACVDLGTNDNCAGCDDACTSGCSCAGIECEDSTGAACQ